jgi:hypothetical protein
LAQPHWHAVFGSRERKDAQCFLLAPEIFAANFSDLSVGRLGMRAFSVALGKIEQARKPAAGQMRWCQGLRWHAVGEPCIAGTQLAERTTD